MRLLLWVLLVTLLTFLSSTTATSSKLSNPDAATVDSTFPVPAAYAGYDVKRSRRLRAEDTEVAVNDDSVEEERAYSVSDIWNRASKALRTRISAQAQKSLDFVVKRAFAYGYKHGVTPEALRARMMGKNNPYVGEYKVWYDKAVAAEKAAKRL
ncbi:hypothetical protein PF008_g14624 [Phytophthora fragariae]|uniref:RxLR effector protein n=1 Tax=Phytophthora fragariae TaxID=53985 RepID=A0A6G0RGL5_9STRA|nr:hypothetical protein PF008_g14624 [Phytophthora fragariae]